jgi:hypothetical protein
MDTKTVLKIISLPISKLPERHSRYRVHPVDDGKSMGLHSTGRLKMQTSLFKRLMEPHHFTASVDSNSMAGQFSHQIVRSARCVR